MFKISLNRWYKHVTSFYVFMGMNEWWKSYFVSKHREHPYKISKVHQLRISHNSSLIHVLFYTSNNCPQHFALIVIKDKKRKIYSHWKVAKNVNILLMCCWHHVPFLTKWRMTNCKLHDLWNTQSFTTSLPSRFLYSRINSLSEEERSDL